ncbi:MAG: hypothetical protein V4573_01660 [Pseudomonadota bacterium]
MSKKPLSGPPTRPLLKALDQNDGVKKVVKQSADELLVINAVLKKGIPDQAQTGDVAQALQKTEDIEDTIQESAESLAEVNQLLEHEVDERISLERELLATQTALARANKELPKD